MAALLDFQFDLALVKLEDCMEESGTGVVQRLFFPSILSDGFYV